ncbi:MAG: ankyrin repeat domain-containing protein [Chitinophagaceae bacterium]
MKKTLLAILSFATITAGAQQKNVFLDQAFWKTNPSVDAVKAEIAKGSNPAESNSNAFDGVVMAINSMAPNESIKFMLDQKGNEINKITHDSRTYIFWAANRGNVELVEYLLSKGARIDLEDSHGTSPMGFAAGGGQANPKLYEAFFKAGADVKILNRDGANLLMLGIANDKDLALTNFLVSKGLSLQSADKNGNTVFNYAARTGNTKLLNTLLEKGVKYTDNALLMAAQGTRGTANTLEVYEYLVNLKIKPTAVNANGENVLHILARKPNQKEIISYFIAKGVNPTQADNDGNTPFINAAATIKDTATLSLLLGAPKNINNTNKKGIAALALAVRSNSPEIVSYLLSKGADTKITDAEGSNLASYLVQSYSEQRAAEFEAKLKLLQDKGFAVNTPQKNGNTLYHLAVAKGDLALLKRVSQLSVDVNAKNNEGLTPLHRAAMIAKDDAILKYLLSAGAKKDLTTEFKETAFDLAVENENFSKNNIKPDFLK